MIAKRRTPNRSQKRRSEQRLVTMLPEQWSSIEALAVDTGHVHADGRPNISALMRSGVSVYGYAVRRNAAHGMPTCDVCGVAVPPDELEGCAGCGTV